MNPDRNAPDPRLYALVAFGLAALALAAIWLPAAPLGTDTPTHLLFARMVAAPELFADWVVVRYTPTSQLYVWLVAPLTPLGPVLAGKLGLTLLAALHAAGAFAVGRALGDRAPAGLLVGLLTTQSFVAAMGFSNFALAAALGLFTIALAIRAWQSPGTGRWLALGVAMLVVAHAHVMVAGMVGAQLVLLALGWKAEGRARRVVTTVFTLVPAGVFSLVVALTARAEYSADVAEGLSTQRLPLGDVLGNIADASLGGMSALPWLALIAIAAAVAARTADRAVRGAVLLAAATWGALYFVVPFHGWGWAYAQPRVLVPLVVFTGALAGWGKRPNLILGLLALGGALHLGSATFEGVRTGERVAAQLDASRTDSPGRVLDVVLDPGPAPNADVQPLLHTGKYALWEGGITPLMPPYSAMIHSARPVWDVPPHVPPFAYRGGTGPDSPLRIRVPLQGLVFDHVVLVGGDASWAETMASRGYERVTEAVWRPRPSGMDVELALPPEAATAPLTVRAGYPDSLGWVAGRTRPPLPLDEPTTRIQLAPLPAGPIVLEYAVGAPGAEQPLGRYTLDLPPGATLRVGIDAERRAVVVP